MSAWSWILLLGLGACASHDSSSRYKSPPELPEGDPHYSAYAADGFTIYSPEEKREGTSPRYFYYKACSIENFSPGFPSHQYGCDDRNR